MLPPKIVCNDAPIVPTMLRDRTTIPRTTPRFSMTSNPGSSKAVVTRSWLMVVKTISLMLIRVVRPRAIQLEPFFSDLLEPADSPDWTIRSTLIRRTRVGSARRTVSW